MASTQPSMDVFDGKYRMPALEGVRARVKVTGVIGSRNLIIDDGYMTVTPEEGPVDCTITCFEPLDLVRILTGELNPVTAALQGRVDVDGDRVLALAIAGSMPELRARLSATQQSKGA